jgi:hypothetical protein
MPAKAKPEPHGREHSTVSSLTEWVRQGTESFFATQRILLDLVMRQNAKTVGAIREQMTTAGAMPVAALTEMTGEGVSNFIAAQRVLLQLAQKQNDILMNGVKERAGFGPAAAMTDLLRRGIDTFIDMEQHFLTMAARQADIWIDSAKEGRPFEGKGLPELARDAMENFVRSQKKLLDVVAEETAHATESIGNGNGKAAAHGKKTELVELARQSAEAFIDAQRKLLDVAAQQLAVNLKTAQRTVQAINPLPPATLADLTRQTVDSLVTAQKALLDAMPKAAREHHEAHPRKPAGRKRPVVKAVVKPTPVPA